MDTTPRRVERSRRERSGGNSTGKAPASKKAVIAHDEVNDLVCRAFNLTESCRVLDLEVRAMQLELDKLRAMCEALNDRMTVPRSRRRKSSPSEQPATHTPPKASSVEPPGLRPMDDEEWQALMGEESPPKRQLSFYDGT